MGYERKRGKLADLNALLRGGGERPLLARRRRDRGAVEREVRDHARHRHAAAARLGAAVRRRDGAPAEPRALRCRRQARRRRAGDRRLRDPAAARERQPARREPLAVRAPARRRAGHRPLYARRLRRLPGVFGEGSFIGKGIYDVDAFERALERPLSREPDPEPRPARGLLRALRAAERRAAVRGVSVDLRRGRQPPAPLDSRRLAARGLAAAARARPRQAPADAIRCRRCRSGSSSTTCGAASSRRR